MVKAPFIYRLKCNTCNSFFLKEGLIPEYTCTIDPTHEIDPNYLGILDDSNMQKDCSKDYKKHRKDLINRIVASGSEMTNTELYYAAAHFCTPREIRDQFFTLQEQVELGKEFHRRSTESRYLRWNIGLVTLYNYISLEDSFIVGREAENLAFRYLQYGVEGTSEGDEEGLFDYLTAASGTSYATTGLPTKGFTVLVSGVTMQDVSTYIMAILKPE